MRAGKNGANYRLLPNLHVGERVQGPGANFPVSTSKGENVRKCAKMCENVEEIGQISKPFQVISSHFGLFNAGVVT